MNRFRTGRDSADAGDDLYLLRIGWGEGVGTTDEVSPHLGLAGETVCSDLYHLKK